MPQPQLEIDTVAEELNSILNDSSVDGVVSFEKVDEERLKSIFWRLKKIAKVSPTSPKLHGLFGQAFCLLKKEEECRKSHLRSIELSPKESIYYFNYAISLRSMAISDDSIKYFKAGLDISPDDIKALECLATSLSTARRYDEAVEAVDQLLKLEKTEGNMELKSRILMDKVMSEYEKLPPVDTSVSGTEEEREEEEMRIYKNTKWIRQEVNKLLPT